MLVYDNESNEKRKDCVSCSSFFYFIFVVCEQFSVGGGGVVDDGYVYVDHVLCVKSACRRCLLLICGQNIRLGHLINCPEAIISW